MNLIRLFILTSVLVMLSGCRDSNDGVTASGIMPAEALKRLNATIDNAGVYSRAKDSTLDSLKGRLKDPDAGRRWETLIELSGQYRQVNTDSAIHYARIAAASTPGNLSEELRIRGKLVLANALSTSGQFPPAIELLDSLRYGPHNMQSKIELWKSERMLYSYMLAFVQNQGEYADMFRKKYIECDDSLLAHLPGEDNFHKFIHSERLVSDGMWEDAEKNLRQLLDSNPPESNIHGMAAFQLAEVYKNKGDFLRYAEALVLSAQSDIMGCVKEGLALPTLANWLYHQGDIENAFNFINFALEEANSGNIRMRTVTIMPMMPMIDRTYRQKINASRNTIMGYFMASSVLFLIAAGLSAVLIRMIHNNRKNEMRLAASSRTLEAYVGNFIGLCSNYATRLDQLAKLVTRKISSGQTDELNKLVSSGRFAEEDNEEFYQLIDKAILDIFPDFVSNINSLLLPEKKIVLKPGEALNPELRIYAFIRLGVDQSTRIAQILHYSVNTVYSYRNRMRNRAICRDNFDADVMRLNRGNGMSGSGL